MKKILILGGTMFVGRFLTETLLGSGNYDITLFNRGKSNAGLFTGVKQVHGDRETEDIKKLYGQHWDCVIDFSAYYPESLEQFLKDMHGHIGRYIFISTISVFNLPAYQGKLITEEAEMLACTSAQRVSKLPDAYGEKKAEMERILLSYPGLDTLIFRPSYIYGKFDWTERFYYWLYRVQNCDRFLLPDAGQPKSISLSNAGDLVQALVQAIEIKAHSTVYNAVSTPSITIRELLSLAARAYGKQPEVITISPAQLESPGLQAPQFPLVSPLGFQVGNTLWEKDFPFVRNDIISTLLEMREYNAANGYPEPKAGLSSAREQALIKSLHL